jgi:DNA-directed RNA polymerase subunit E'/Rpb7
MSLPNARDVQDDADVFVSCVLKDRVTLRPELQNMHMEKSILELLRFNVEGRCRQYGFVRPGSVEVVRIGEGVVDMAAMDGGCVFDVTFRAAVCNPPVDSHLRCRVENVNSYGILAANLSEHRVLEVIIPRSAASFEHEVDFDSISAGSILNVQIVGKRYALDQPTITVIGRIVSHDLPVQPALDVMSDPDLDDDDDDDDTAVPEDEDTSPDAALGDEDEEEAEPEAEDEPDVEDEPEGEEEPDAEALGPDDDEDDNDADSDADAPVSDLGDSDADTAA